MRKRDAAGAEALLREHEQRYVGACGKFLERGPSGNHVWALRGNAGEPSALIIHAGGTLMPALCGAKEIPAPRFSGGLFSRAVVHSVQGLRGEAIAVETALERMGRKTRENNDYDLMAIDTAPDAGCFSAGPPGLVLRIPRYTDMDAVAALQAGYEKEEVLPRGAVFNPAASRINAARIVGKARILCAELEGRLVGKINVNAVSFTRFQVGGVYVHPDFRGKGIARRMAAEFIGSLVAEGRGVTLFVKKSNAAARKVYDRLGFSAIGDYRISYY